MRFSPSSFDPHDPKLAAIPLPVEWQWESCEHALTLLGSTFLLSRLPLFWQIEPILHVACRSVGVTVFHNDAKNMPVGAAAIREVGADTVLTTAEDAYAFATYLAERNAMPKHWLIIHKADTDWVLPQLLRESDARVAQEVHLHPGFPILAQCPNQLKEKSSLFHVADGHAKKHIDALSFLKTITCTCGETAYARA